MSIFDTIVSSETSNGIISTPEVVDPSLGGTTIPTVPNDSEPIVYDDPLTPRDNRSAPDTGRLIHNWWVAYMKSLKKFFNETFDDSIINYEFNYASKSMLLKRLYNNIQHQNPSSIINLESFTTDSNLDPQRRNSGFINIEQTVPIAKNTSKSQEIRVDFKFVNLQQTIIIIFNDSSDVLNYYDRLTTIYPLNIDFISYDYLTYINIHNETKDWDVVNDVTEGLIIDAAELGSDNMAGKNSWEAYLAPQRWAQYKCTPTFTLQGINQLVDKQNEKYQLQLTMSTRIRVPQTLLVRAMDNIKIRAIQVVVELADQETDFKNELKLVSDENGETTGVTKNEDYQKPRPLGDSSFKPICIDMDRNVYTSYKNDKSIYLDPLLNIIREKTEILRPMPSDPDDPNSEIKYEPSGYFREDGYLILPGHFQPLIDNHGVALFIVQDSTVNDPRLFWSELGILNKNDTDLSDPKYEEYKDFIREYSIEIWDQEKVNNVYSSALELNPNLEIPNAIVPIEIIKIKIWNFDEWIEIYKDIGPWFYIKMLTFKTTDPDEDSL